MGFFVIHLLMFLQLSNADTIIQPYPVTTPRTGEECVVCGTPVAQGDLVLIVRGRRVPLKREMVKEFLQNEDKYFARLQPKGALFQEEMHASPGTSLGGVGQGWFLAGLVVLMSLLFGGLSGYVAVSKGLKPLPHFFIGFFFNLIGFIYVLARKSPVKRGAVPRGLTKIHSTSDPISCPQCGGMNHPASRRCLSCCAALTPTAESEVERAG